MKRKLKQLVALALCLLMVVNISEIQSMAAVLINQSESDTTNTAKTDTAHSTTDDSTQNKETQQNQDAETTNECTDLDNAAAQLDDLYASVDFENIKNENFGTNTLLIQMQAGCILENTYNSTNFLSIGDDVYVLSFSSPTDAENAYHSLSEDSSVVSVEVDTIFESETSNAVSADEIYSLYLYNEYNEQKLADSTSEVTIAVIDTKVSPDNTVAANRILQGSEFLSDTTGMMAGNSSATNETLTHGELMADILLSYTNDNVKILPLAAFNENGQGTVLTTYLAIKYAIENNVNVINLSLNGKGTSKLLETAINEARENNIIVIAAAGNQTDDASKYMPGNIEGTITVGAVNSDNEIEEYSNTGDCIDVVAYGNYATEDISYSGTSISTAYASIEAALLIQTALMENNEYNAENIETLILNNATDLGEPGKDSIYGYGVIGMEPFFMDSDTQDSTDTEISTDTNTKIEESESTKETADLDISVDEEQELSVQTDFSNPIDIYNNLGSTIAEYGGSLYWASRAKQSSTSATGYNAVGWHVQLSNDAGQYIQFQLYLDSTINSYAVMQTEGGVVYKYTQFKISANTLIQKTREQCNANDFFDSTVHVTMNAIMNVKYANIDHGTYNLVVDSEYETMKEVLNILNFTSTSISNLETYRNKRVDFDGNNVIPHYNQTLKFYKYIPTTGINEYMTEKVTRVAKDETFTPTTNGVTTPAGYHFEGFDSESDSWTVTSDVTVNGYYKPNNYTVYFNTNKPSSSTSRVSCSVSSKNVTYSDYYGTLPTPTMAGYIFNGWYTSPTGGTKVSSSNIYTTIGNSTLYAHWTPITYTVKYMANGGTAGTVADSTFTYDTKKTTRKNNYYRAGFTFIGWNTKADGTGTMYGSQSTNGVVTFTKDLTTVNKATIKLYAQWKVNKIHVAYIGFEQTLGDDFIEYEVTEPYEPPTYDYYTLYDNLTDDNKQYFKKTKTVSYEDEETGMTINQTVTETVIGWSLTKRDDSTPEYLLGQTIEGWRLSDAATAAGNKTFNAPNADFALYPENTTSSVADGFDSQYPFVNLYAVWDEGPEIIAYDIYTTLEEVEKGNITEEYLMSYASATDKEDGTLQKQENAAIGNDKYTTFHIVDYAPEDFETAQAGEVSITYEAIDSVGNITHQMVMVHIIDSSAQLTANDKTKLRFIDENYLDTLSDNSIWKKDAEYSALLQDTLENMSAKTSSEEQVTPFPGYTVTKPGSGTFASEPMQTWTFTSEDAQNVKEYITANGIGNLTASGAVDQNNLKRFISTFQSCKS